MTGRPWRALTGIAMAATVLCLGVVLGLPFSSPAQQPAKPAATAAAPADSNYVGRGDLQGLSRGGVQQVLQDQDGTPLPLPGAERPKEKNACENCHGPGKAHVDAGGGKGKGGLITFAKNDPTPVEKRNAVCLDCHTKGARIFWKGSAHESRRRRLHELSHGDGQRLAEAPARQGDRDRDLRHLPSRRSGPRRCGARTCRSARAR